MARAVGPSGRVYATDIQPGMIEILAPPAVERLAHVVPVLGTAEDPAAPGCHRLALMVDVYHELSSPQVFMRRLRETLAPGGRLVLVEYRKEDPRVPIQPLHKMSVGQVRQELGADGYTIDRVIDVLPWQHVIVLRRTE